MKTTVGSYLVIWITGGVRQYIVEVVEEEPLVLKIEESGPCSRLREGDYIIDETLSERIQKDGDDTKVLQEAVDRGHPLCSGLRSLGVEDDKIHDILPA